MRINAILLLSMLLSVNALAQPTPDVPDEPLTVGIAILPPNVIASEQHPGSFEGFDIDLWEAVADIIGVDYEFHQVTFEQLLEEVARGEADVGLAGITIRREREEQMDFSHPYMQSGLRILSRRGSYSLAALWDTVSESGALRWIFYLLLFLVLCAHVLYFAEKGSMGISDDYFPGIFEAAWCILATMTTVGYGDVVPHRWTGRIVAFLVMVTGIALFGIVIAQLSVGLTFSRMQAEINEPEDLRGKVVATVAGSTSVDFIQRVGGRADEVDTIDIAYQRLLEGAVDAVVFDGPALRYYTKNLPATEIVFAGGLFEEQSYGLAFPNDSPLREMVNRALLELQENGVYEEIHAKWLGTD